jgi:hypothetical protein
MWAMIIAAITAATAIVAIMITWCQTKGLKEAFNSELFSKLLEQLGSEDARRDRSIIRRISEDNKPSVLLEVKT